MPQNTNLNVSPYFDDFDDNKGYQKVLFKPGTSIQARELTTLQSILQSQVEKFGQHFFKDGSVVIPGQVSYDPDYTCIQINQTHLGIPVSEYINNFVGKLIQGQTSGVVAKVENFIDNQQSLNSNYTLYVKYLSSSNTDFITPTFIDGENLISLENIDYSLSTIRTNSTFASTISNNSNAIGSAVNITDGVYFVKGFFIKVPQQTVILDQYSNLPSYRVGLTINEEIAIASNNFDDLYDNAQGFSNFASPGADRLKISLELSKKSLQDFNDENFIELLRVRNGEIEKFVENTNYTLIRDELARRTYDESGDYYIKPFDISTKECLNDRIGNNGVFYSGEITRQGNIASNDLISLSLSSGKAYVRGYEVETRGELLDLDKPRTTEKVENENLQFTFGNQIIVNNVYNSLNLGLGNTNQVSLYRDRNSTKGISNGDLIGISKVYDYQARNTSHQGPQTQYVVSLYDTELFTKIKVNFNIQSLTIPALIEGVNSGAKGFLYQTVTNSNEIILYDTFGSFSLNEALIINGVSSNKLVTEINDFEIGDVNQISISGTGVTFTSDTLLSKKISLTENNTFTITAASGGISTVTSTGISFSKVKSGDIISYTKPGNTIITYNKIQTINSSVGNFTVVSTPNISGVNTGSLPTSQVTVTDLYKIQPTIINPESNFYQLLENTTISNVDLNDTVISIKKSFTDIVSTTSKTFVINDADLIFDSFDQENYTLSFSNSGNVVELKELENISFSSDRKTVTITQLTETGPVIFTALCKKSNINFRNKFYNRCSSLIVNKSNLVSSGTGSTTLNDGLTYSNIYGLRVQDKEISLNIADVEKVLAIYESSNINNPTAPKLELTNLSNVIQNSVKGEKIIGNTSKSVGYLIDYLTSDTVEYVEANENKFIPGETVIFEESKITAEITEVILGDRNIISIFDFDNGYRDQYLDFSRIIRKSTFSSPNRKLRIIYNNYTIKSTDSGDLITVNSYGKDRYLNDLPIYKDVYASDYLDFRPIVAEYSGTNSPFESKSRIFTSVSSSSPHIISRNSIVNVDYEYYLPRIDKLFLFQDGAFNFSRGVPSKNTAIPPNLENGLEVATIKMPAYVRNINDISITFTQHKRYTMKDISMLDDKIKNIEQYTILSLLELDTKNLFLKDGITNLNKFKSGFFVDTFRNSVGSDILNPDYKASLDMKSGELRPIHYTTSLDLIPGSNGVTSNIKDLKYSLDLGSNQVKKVGNTVCLQYEDVEYLSNNFASLVENVNPFNISNWVVPLTLNPSSDTWIETRLIDNKNNLDYIKAIKNLNQDTNAGILPYEWNSWDTIWAGSTFTETLYKNLNSNSQITNYSQTEAYNNIRIGDKKLSTDFKKYIRSRNIELISKNLKPNTRLYAFFDDVNVTEYIIPKLIEINMISGTFIPGETVVGVLGSKQIRFRVAPLNHKFGPVDTTITNLTDNYEIDVYLNDIYNPNNTLASSYSATSTILNVDTSSLSSIGVAEFFGCISIGMNLIGNQSKATATVSNLRLITDEYGTFIGALFIPDATISSTPAFETGSKTISLTTNQNNSKIYSFSDCISIAKFDASGLLETPESSVLRLRNSYSELSETQTQKLIKSENGDVIINLVNNTPLSQTFAVEESSGVYLTKCDIYFKTKDNNIPISLQIKTVELGIPTKSILPFGEVTLNPKSIVTSENGTLATTFYFESPVYLEGNNQYAISLVTSSNSYNVWISRVGDPDISTDGTDDNKIIVSQQPNLGSLYKFQPGNTWSTSTYDDLKFKLYRAEFTSNNGTVYFYNPDLNIGNNQIASLVNNPIYSYSKSSLVSIGKSLTENDRNLLVPGATITLANNNDDGYFRADLVETLGAIGIGSTLIITNQGSGFGNTTTTYSNVNLISNIGYGISATANINVISGVAQTVTIVNGGLGYSPGDILTIDTNNTNNLGSNLILTVPNNSGIITNYNSVYVSNLQGRIDLVQPNNNLVSNGTTITGATISNFYDNFDDGIHFKVNHSNHGMYSYNNYVTIVGIEPDIPPVKLTTNIDSNSTSITLSSVGILTAFENLPISSGNPGYLLINNEIIRYTSVDLNTNTISGILRFDLIFFENNTDELLKQTYFNQSHFAGDDVFKYEFNGISLLRINKTHYLDEVNKTKHPITLDSYHIKINLSTYQSGGVTYLNDRRNGFTTNPLFFNNSKFGGTFINSQNQVNTLKGPKATQNILMTSIRPNIQTLIPKNTNITSRIRTITGTSINGNESSFIDKGFNGTSLDTTTFFDSPKLICSKINESNQISADVPGKKSFTLEFNLKTNDSKVSPMIDLERVNIITTMNRLDSPVSNYITDNRVNKLNEDPHASVYVSKLINLNVPADSLKVIFDAYRHSTNDIRVAYRLIRDNAPLEQQVYELFPGYGNFDVNKNTINSSNNTGLPDLVIPSSFNADDLKLYEYTVNNLPQFTGFQIKIMMSGTNQIYVPRFKNFRAIASLSTSPE